MILIWVKRRSEHKILRVGVETGGGRFGAVLSWEEADVEIWIYPGYPTGARYGDTPERMTEKHLYRNYSTSTRAVLPLGLANLCYGEQGGQAV